MQRIWTAPVLMLLAAGAACTTQTTGGGPQPEVVDDTKQVKLDLPAPPDFAEPKPYGDGSHSVTEMRLRSAKFLEQEVKVTGFVVFKYDLETCARTVGEKMVQKEPKLCDGKKDVNDCTLKVGQKSVADSPDQCDRPYFYLADAPNASFEKSLWVVEVPRPLRDDEKRDPQLVEAFKKGPQPPTLTAGQKVTVTGKWAIKSPQGFGNSDGLLVYAAFQPAT